MNKWNRLLKTLDHTFGFRDQKKSTFRKVSQTFDERTNEHVIMIEYRVRRGDPRWFGELRNTGMLTRLVWGPDGWLVGSASLDALLGKLRPYH